MSYLPPGSTIGILGAGRVGTAVAAFVELAIEAEEPSPEGDAGVTPDSGTPAADGGPIVEEEAGVLEDAAVDVEVRQRLLEGVRRGPGPPRPGGR